MAAAVKIAILISGRGSNMKTLVQHSERAGVDVVLVGADRACDGLDWADSHDIHTSCADRTIYQTKMQREDVLAEAIEKSQADWIFLAGFMAILSAEFISRFSGRILNIHPSLLPDFKGLDTHQRVLEARHRHHGASIHLVTPGLDDGPVILQAGLEVATSSADELASEVLKIEHLIYPAVMTALGTGTLTLSADQICWADSAELPQPPEAGMSFITPFSLSS